MLLEQYPAVTRKELKIALTSLHAGLLSKSNDISISMGNRKFCMTLSKPRSFKLKLKMCAELLTLVEDISKEDTVIYGKAKTLLSPWLMIGEVQACKHPAKLELQEMLQQRKALLQTAKSNIIKRQQNQQDLINIANLRQSSESIQQLDFKAQEAQLCNLFKRLPHEDQSGIIITQLLQHLQLYEAHDAITKKLDTQVKVSINATKESFVKNLASLAVKLIKDHQNAEHSFNLEMLTWEDYPILFVQIGNDFDLSDDLFELPQKTHEAFCSAIEQARTLITNVHNVTSAQGLKPEYVGSIEALANSINQFYIMRQCHPYAIDIPKKCDAVARHSLLEQILFGLEQRLKTEKEYLQASSQPNSKESAAIKRKILLDFLTHINKGYMPINNLKALLKQLAVPGISSALQIEDACSSSALASNSVFSKAANSGKENQTPKACAIKASV